MRRPRGPFSRRRRARELVTSVPCPAQLGLAQQTANHAADAPAVEILLAVRIVDLTHHLADDMPLYPGLPSPSFHDFAEVERDGYAMSEYHLRNHIGTHVDAPSPHIARGATLHDIALLSFHTQADTLPLSPRARGAGGGREREPP